MPVSKPIFDVNGIMLEGCSQLEYEDKLISRNWLHFLDCMQVAGGDPEKLTSVSKGIQNILKGVKDLNGSASESKMSELESFIRSSAPNQIDILLPKQRNIKGSGKRIKGGKEKAIEQQGKKLRRCKAYGQQAYHDSCSYEGGDVGSDSGDGRLRRGGRVYYRWQGSDVVVCLAGSGFEEGGHVRRVATQGQTTASRSRRSGPLMTG
ncbi:hypothetical protein Cgig2_025654 [Carnegiea gigantea]|uniref:Uncharacterized protein n=1 Tax=Carnegiea gigantea TaxID=171969 RepID=A0A9Q1GIQ6_9CARY|nr:hypothetical protein Cgig2_025654 [Carnegiea gigantea]